MKIGAIGIRTKIIVGDAATWYLIKKYLDNVVIKGGITPEERDKLASIEENANDYTHPETHPASILDVVDVVNGDAKKFLNERGEMVAISSIGVTGSQLYASTENSDVAGYKSLVGTPQALETEITLTAKSSDGIVWGDKYLSAPFTEAVTIPTTAYGFDYWRKVSASNGTSRKHLRVFIYRAGVETNIGNILVSPDIDETEFTERQISYIFPELMLLVGDRIGIQEGFSTTHANNITLTYIVGDGRGWFMRLPLPLKHESLTDKNSEAAFQHIDATTTKTTSDASDMVAIKDSVTGKMVLTPKSNFDADNLVAEYIHSSNIEYYVTAIDSTNDTLTFENVSGLVLNQRLFLTLNKFTGAKLTDVVPFSVAGLNLLTVESISGNLVKLKVNGSNTLDILTKMHDLGAFHFENMNSYNINITDLELKSGKICFYGQRGFGGSFQVLINGQSRQYSLNNLATTNGGIIIRTEFTSILQVEIAFNIFDDIFIAKTENRIQALTTNTYINSSELFRATDQISSLQSIKINNNAMKNGFTLKVYRS